MVLEIIKNNEKLARIVVDMIPFKVADTIEFDGKLHTVSSIRTCCYFFANFGREDKQAEAEVKVFIKDA